MKNYIKKLTAKLRSKSFWVALTGAIALIAAQAKVGLSAVEKIIEAVGGILVLLGIVSSPAGDIAAPTDPDFTADPPDDDTSE